MEKTLQLELDRSREKPVFNNRIDYAINTRNGNRHIELKYDKDVYTMFIKDSADMIKNVYIATTDERITK